ncbi:MAG: hypothetical protein CVU48_07230 [Candidatus Cloacimonetes bacterium HGW-Cloacimonetes-1]|nr:MAG: hypothetical protein CVU48_07230 [Candidatus Cloacimonetes bacterium HGW-Cloacimonetes-1]
MKITLPDSTVVDTADILRVSSIRDDAQDEYSIENSTLLFNIKLRGGETIPVPVYYHYSDWAQKKMEITKLRNHIMTQLEKHRANEQ